MSDNLAKKLQIKRGQKILTVNAPDNYSRLLAPLPDNVTLVNKTAEIFDHIHLFVRNSAELIDQLARNAELFHADTLLWIAYPKKTSAIKSDLDIMKSWAEPEKYGLRPVASVSIDDTWTGLRLSWSNKKEYLIWILSAKQEKTRICRIQKTIERLAGGKRNPTEK